MATATRTEDTGLVVVGASIAGLVAAITAADRGHRVVLVERTKDLGGLAASSAETIAAAATRFQRVADVVDTTKLFLTDATPGMHGDVPPAVAEAIIGQSASLVEWLADRCGAQVALQSAKTSGGHARPRLHSVGDQGGASLITVLARAASHHTHIRLRTATEVDRLVPSDDGGVVGVALKPDRRGATVLRGPVLLACGGFVGNDELVSEHCATAKALPYVAAAGAMGDAIRLTTPLGAGVRNMAACAVTPLLAQPSHLAVSRAILDRGAVLVNQRGARFTDEKQASLPLAIAVRGQLGRLAYLLFDERIAAELGADDPYFARVVLPRASRRAGAVGMLAKQLELDLPGLTATIVASGLQEPFYGMRVTGARRVTLGGLAVDAQARVLDRMGNTISGLFAAGGAAAGLGYDEADGGLAGMDALAGLALARLAAQSLASVVEDG